MNTSISDDYSRLYIVRQCHNILHLDSSLSPSSNDFAITYSSLWNDYSRSLLPVPLICAVLGILALFIFQIFLWVRICHKSLRCLPSRIVGSGIITDDRLDRAVYKRYRVFFIIFIVFALLTILTDQMLIFGNRYVSQGVNTSRDAVNYLYDLSSTLTNQGNSLLSDASILQADLTQADAQGCAAGDSLATGVNTFNSYVNDYLAVVDPLPDQ
jgi:hypothetical protein